MDITQGKVIEEKVRPWVLDVDYIKTVVPWARRRPELLERELDEMSRFFSMMITTIARSSGSLISCPRCTELLVFWDGLGCVNCRTEFEPPRDFLLGYYGELRAEHLLLGEISGSKLKGRPCLKRIIQKIESTRGERKNLYKKYVFEIEGKIFFTPLILALFSHEWPGSQPHTFFEHEYFKILGISIEHAFTKGSGRYELCIYASWHSQTMRSVIQQRIVPRVLIDLMFADLIAVGSLSNVLNNLGATFHNVYNYIGKPRRTNDFRREYERYVDVTREFE